MSISRKKNKTFYRRQINYLLNQARENIQLKSIQPTELDRPDQTNVSPLLAQFEGEEGRWVSEERIWQPTMAGNFHFKPHHVLMFIAFMMLTSYGTASSVTNRENGEDRDIYAPPDSMVLSYFLEAAQIANNLSTWIRAGAKPILYQPVATLQAARLLGAISRDSHEIVATLLNKEPALATQSLLQGVNLSPWLMAALCGSRQVLAYLYENLIRYNIDIYEQIVRNSEHRHDAFYLASLTNNIETVLYLEDIGQYMAKHLENKEFSNIIDSVWMTKGRTIFHMKALKAKGIDLNPHAAYFFHLSLKGINNKEYATQFHQTLIHLLSNKLIDPELTYEGFTLFHRLLNTAIENGNYSLFLPIMKTLLLYGVDINQQVSETLPISVALTQVILNPQKGLPLFDFFCRYPKAITEFVNRHIYAFSFHRESDRAYLTSIMEIIPTLMENKNTRKFVKVLEKRLNVNDLLEFYQDKLRRNVLTIVSINILIKTMYFGGSTLLAKYILTSATWVLNKIIAKSKTPPGDSLQLLPSIPANTPSPLKKEKQSPFSGTVTQTVNVTEKPDEDERKKFLELKRQQKIATKNLKLKEERKRANKKDKIAIALAKAIKTQSTEIKHVASAEKQIKKKHANEKQLRIMKIELPANNRPFHSLVSRADLLCGAKKTACAFVAVSCSSSSDSAILHLNFLYHAMRYFLLMSCYLKKLHLKKWDDETIVDMIVGRTIIAHKGMEITNDQVQALKKELPPFMARELSRVPSNHASESAYSKEEIDSLNLCHEPASIVSSLNQINLFKFVAQLPAHNNLHNEKNSSTKRDDQKYYAWVLHLIIPMLNYISQTHESPTFKLNAMRMLFVWCGEFFNPQRERRFEKNHTKMLEFFKQSHTLRNKEAHELAGVTNDAVTALADLAKQLSNESKSPGANEKFSFSILEFRS